MLRTVVERIAWDELRVGALSEQFMFIVVARYNEDKLTRTLVALAQFSLWIRMLTRTHAVQGSL